MGQDRVILPGFGQPLNDDLPTIEKEGPYKGQRRRFPHALRDSCYSVGVSVRERRMLDFINKITDKPEWERKVFDEDIVSKWRSEACVHSEELDDYYLSAAMFDYVGTAWSLSLDWNAYLIIYSVSKNFATKLLTSTTLRWCLYMTVRLQS